MGDELFCSTWANRTIPTVFFPAIFFFSELLYPPIFMHDVDCAFGILQSGTSSATFFGYPNLCGVYSSARFSSSVYGGHTHVLYSLVRAFEFEPITVILVCGHHSAFSGFNVSCPWQEVAVSTVSFLLLFLVPFFFCCAF